MRYTEHDEPASQLPSQLKGPETTEERLLRENLELRRQVQELRRGGHTADSKAGDVWHPSRLTISAILLTAFALFAIAFLAGYIPIQKRNSLIAAEAREQDRPPRVEYISVGRSTRNSGLELPGNIQAITEAPILARAEGFVKRRFADLGDRVHAGQVLAEIDAPELDDQVRQARASLEQAKAALDQAQANLQQGRSDLDLARLTAERWTALVAKGAVSKHENDQYQSQYVSKQANVQSLEKAVNVQRSNIGAAEANVARLEQMQAYRIVKAPFDGVITLRNIDVGALVNSGNTLLFRIAQTGVLRTYVNVPQSNAGSVRVGQPAILTLSSIPGREFAGRVARTANALDPATRTLLAEVQVPNPNGTLLPGMYAEVDLSSARSNPPLLVPSDALILRADGAQIATVSRDNTVHIQKIEVGRDYGDRLEVLAGLREGDRVIPNPGDVAREGMRVEPVPLAPKQKQQ